MSNRIRKSNFVMRIRDVDAELLEARKDEAEMTKADYIRNIILFGSCCERPKIQNNTAEAFYRELNEYGNLINNITHGVNLFKRVDKRDVERLTEIYIALFGVYDQYVRENARHPL